MASALEEAQSEVTSLKSLLRDCQKALEVSRAQAVEREKRLEAVQQLKHWPKRNVALGMHETAVCCQDREFFEQHFENLCSRWWYHACAVAVCPFLTSSSVMPRVRRLLFLNSLRDTSMTSTSSGHKRFSTASISFISCLDGGWLWNWGAKWYAAVCIGRCQRAQRFSKFASMLCNQIASESISARTRRCLSFNAEQ